MVDFFKDLITSVMGGGYDIWNSIISVALNLFVTSPTAAGGGVYSTAYSLYSAISDISLPIAIVFFLIAILKEVTASPPDQQIRRFFNDAIKFGIMVGILANLWTIMGYIIQIADGLTSNLVGGASFSMTVPSSITTLLDSVFVEPDLADGIAKFLVDVVKALFLGIVFLLLSLINGAILIASSVSILSCAFHRILKPLVLLPFSCVTVALAAGTGDAERVATSYLKTFFGFCISGAFMVICISLGTALGSSLISISTGGGAVMDFIAIMVQSAVIPIIVAGLVKSADSILGKFL